MRVKGTVIIDFVKTIRSLKDVDWDRYLEPADHQIVDGIILASSYYPGDSFWRICWAVNQETSSGNLDNAFQFGRMSAKSYLAVYKRPIVDGDPVKTVANFVNNWHQFYDCEGQPYTKMEMDSGPGFIRITAYDYPDMTIPEMREPYFHGLAGYFQEIAEHVRQNPIRCSVKDHGTSFEFTYRW